jgi:hypothetical protein
MPIISAMNSSDGGFHGLARRIFGRSDGMGKVGSVRWLGTGARNL